MNIGEGWFSRFGAAFDSMQLDLAAVLPAAGCREGWIQAELFRRLRTTDPAFVVNTHSLGPRKTADLYGEIPSRMVGEIKVYGIAGFFHKNIDGRSNIDRYRPIEPTARRRIGEAEARKAEPQPGSLLSAYLRMLDAEPGVQRFLILVLHMNAEPDALGKALLALRFSDVERTWEYPGVLVRIWKV